MANELIKEKIYLDKQVGSQLSQILIEGDVIVPDVKPDMASILQTQANIIIEKTDTIQGRVNFIGHLELNILYNAKSGENPIYSINNITPIDDFINIDGVESGMSTEVSAQINKIDYKMLNDRKINFRAVVDINVKVQQENEYEIIRSIDSIPQNQLLKENISINRLSETRCDRFIVKDELNIASSKPNIRELLQTDIDICLREVKCLNGKVTVNGELSCKTLYKSDMEDNLIELIENEIPFNGVFDVPKVKDYMQADVKLFVQDKYIQVKTNEDGEDRLIDIEVFIGANIRINSVEEIEILKDAYCIDEKLNITRQSIQYPNIICKNKLQTTLKEIIQLDEECPDIMQILKLNVQPHIDDKHIADDKIIVEGILDIDLLYIAKSDQTPIYSFKTILPYKQIIEARNIMPSMKIDVEVTTERTGFNMLSNDEIETRILMGFDAYVTDQENIQVITQIEFEPIDKEQLEQMPSMVIYIVQDKDKLWDIAKKSNMNIDELKNINELEEDNLIVGQKLLILKEVKP